MYRKLLFIVTVIAAALVAAPAANADPIVPGMRCCSFGGGLFVQNIPKGYTGWAFVYDHDGYFGESHPLFANACPATGYFCVEKIGSVSEGLVVWIAPAKVAGSYSRVERRGEFSKDWYLGLMKEVHLAKVSSW